MEEAKINFDNLIDVHSGHKLEIMIHLQPTSHLCYKDGKLYQLWIDHLYSNEKEWRKVMSAEQAMIDMQCDVFKD